MNSTIRNWLGITLIVALFLLLLKKPFSYPEMQHAFMAPYYVDFWILDIQDWWPFEQSLEGKISGFYYGSNGYKNQYFASLLEVTALISGIIWGAVHIALLTITRIGIYNVFFKKR